MVEARIKASPTDDLVPYLEGVAEALVRINEGWLRQQIAAGLDPPCCTACAEPPWTVGRGVDYVPHHGGRPRGVSREYLDGPTMFARGLGTCMDVVAYDAAALRVKKGERASVRIVPLPGDRNDFHALLLRGTGALEDPAAELAERAPHNVGVVRRNGVIVGRPVRESAAIGSGQPGHFDRSQVRRNQLGADIRGSQNVLIPGGSRLSGQLEPRQQAQSFGSRGRTGSYNVGGCKRCGDG